MMIGLELRELSEIFVAIAVRELVIVRVCGCVFLCSVLGLILMMLWELLG